MVVHMCLSRAGDWGGVGDLGKPITDLAFDAEATTLLSVSQERAAEASGAKWWTVEKTELGEKEQQGEMSREMNLKHKSYLWDQSKMAHLVGAHRGAATHADGLTFTVRPPDSTLPSS